MKTNNRLVLALVAAALLNCGVQNLGYCQQGQVAPTKPEPAAAQSDWKLKEATRLAAFDRETRRKSAVQPQGAIAGAAVAEIIKKDELRAQDEEITRCLAELQPYASEKEYKDGLRKRFAIEEAEIVEKARVKAVVAVARRTQSGVTNLGEQSKDQLKAKYAESMRRELAQKRARHQIGSMGGSPLQTPGL
jgi:hypothetical protein